MTWYRISWISSVLASAFFLSACGDNSAQCGDGTENLNGVCTPLATDPPPPGPDAAPLTPVPEPLRHPDERVAVFDDQADRWVLNTTLNVAVADHTVPRPDDGGCETFRTRSYEGSLPGPTWRMPAGARLDVEVNNMLPENAATHEDLEGVLNVPHDLNTTNLHTHGLHVSPEEPQDNVLVKIEPGESYQYSFDIPDNHPPGTFWYHPHNHGSVMASMYSGMAGLLIIEGDVDEVPEIAAAEEKILIFQAIRVNTECEDPVVNDPMNIHTANSMFADRLPGFTTVNGQHMPVIELRPGEVQRWRLLNGKSDNYMTLRFEPDRPADEPIGDDLPSMRWISIDGLTFAEPVEPAYTLPHNVVQGTANDRRLRLASGNRADILVRGNTPGTYLLMDTGDDLHLHPLEHQVPVPEALAYVVVAGDPIDPAMEFPATLPAANGPGKLLPETLADDPIDQHRDVYFRVCIDDPVQTVADQQQICDDVAAANPMVPKPNFLVDNDLFDHHRVDHCMTLDTIEQWTIYNTSRSEHPFHIHTNAFEVLSLNGVALDTPRWVDTASVPAATYDLKGTDDQSDDEYVAPGSLTFRTELVDYAGPMVLHCHILLHEETGMMQLMQIVDPNAGPPPLACPPPPPPPPAP